MTISMPSREKVEGKRLDQDKGHPILQKHDGGAGKGLQQVEKAVLEIDALIRTGMLRPGQRLVEVDLMQRLGITRSPLREALRVLAGNGAVELIPQRGARVRQYSLDEVISITQLLGALFRQGLEILAEAPERLRACRPRLEKAIDQLGIAKSEIDIKAIFACEIRYQSILFEASGNTHLEPVFHSLRYALHYFQIANIFEAKIVVHCANIYADIHAALAIGDFAAADLHVRRLVSVSIDAARTREHEADRSSNLCVVTI